MSSHSPSPSPGAQRKPRCCRTCGLPMKGHQRSNCISSPLMQPQTSSALMPPPDTIPPGPSQPGARFPTSDTRPIMPGAYANDRPSEISASPGPSPTRSLRERIGAKVEEESTFGVPHYNGEMHDPHYPRHASAPLQAFPTMLVGGSGSAYAASASGSVYGSSSTIVMPEHSVSQRLIRRDRAVSEAVNPIPGRLADRLGGYASDEYLGADNDDYDDDGSFEYNHSYEDEEEDESDPAYPSDGSVVGGAASASSYYASESDAGTFSSSGLSSAASLGALVRGSGASPLWTAYEVGAKYVPFLRDRAKRKGYILRVVPSSQEDDVDGRGQRKRTSREPGNVQIVLGRDDDALRNLTRRTERGDSAMPGPSRPIRNRARSSADLQARYYSPHSPHPPPFQSPYPAPHPALPHPPPAMPAQPQRDNGLLRSPLCLTVSAALVGIFVFLIACVVVIAFLGRSPE